MVKNNPYAKRLHNLRQELTTRGLDGFIIPSTSKYQGDYVLPSANCLKWLTGFSGSVGMALVLANKAAIFVDGRYILQVGEEVDEKLYDRQHLTKQPPHVWIAAHLSTNSKLGYDPWLHTVDDVSDLKKACAKSDSKLVAVKNNPIDIIWVDRPLLSTAPAFAYGVEYAGETSLNKRKRVAQLLDEAYAVVLTAPDSIAWLLNLRGADLPYTPVTLAFAILYADTKVDLFVDPCKFSHKTRDHLGEDVNIRPQEELGSILETLGCRNKRICIDSTNTAYWFSQKLQASGVSLVYKTDPCILLKVCKNDIELKGLRAAHRRDGASLVRFFAWLLRHGIRDGITEIDIAERLEALRRNNELFYSLSFPTIAGSGPNGAIVHYRANTKSNRTLCDGELLLLDSGAQYLDGTTDVTRTIAIGKPGAQECDRFTRVLKGHIALASARFPKGTTGSQIDILARLPLWEIGLDYDHGTGHSVGHFLSVHEGPRLFAKQQQSNGIPLKPGMVVSNEPGYYQTGAYGIRIENLQAVCPMISTEDNVLEMLEFDPLTLCPIDLNLIDVKMMLPQEIAWLDRYHARVRKEIAPLVDGEAAAYLEEATKPVARFKKI